MRYRVYGREMTVRTNWIESRFALLQGPATYLTLVGGFDRPHHVTLDLPAGWTRAMSGLPEMSGRPHTFEAADYDTLVDGPIVAGDLEVYEFSRSGKPHYLVNVNEGGSWDGARAIGDVERIVAEHEKLWGSLPYDKYVFVNMITEASGGLEHRNSSVLMTSRWAMGTRQAYVGWLNLVSHEFFHVWNVKRLRPAALGPFDYENENYTPSLWVSEGFTSYYGDLLVRRAGLSSDAEFFGALSSDIRGLETTPGRLVQPVTQSSYDAWIKQYRPDENSANTSVSYYAKGQVIAALLDARIRLATNGQRSLDDVMRTGPGTVRGGEGLHRGRVPRRDHRGGRRRTRRRPGARPRHDTAARIPAAARRLRPAVRAGRKPRDPGMARHHRPATMAAGWSSRRCGATRLAPSRASTWTTRSSPSATTASARTSGIGGSISTRRRRRRRCWWRGATS